MLNVEDVRARLREACKKSGGQGAWARQYGLTPTYISDVILGKRGPGNKVLEPLGLRKITRFIERREKL